MNILGNKKGFTLSELLLTLGLWGVIMSGVMAFFVQTLKATYIANQRVTQAYNIRNFTQELVTDATRANSFYLYKSSIPADRADDTKRLSIDVTDPLNLLHPAGNFAVFVYYEIPKPKDQALHRVSYVVGYYLDPDVSLAATVAADIRQSGPLRRIIIDLRKSTLTSDPIEKIMTDNWSNVVTTKVKDFLPMVRPLSLPDVIVSTTAPSLFYMRDVSNLMVSGQLYMSGSSKMTDNWMTYTDSFNFSITPRS